MAKDLFHNAVRRALEKQGWRITHDPLELEVGEVNIKIDLGAERLLGAERAGAKIAVEIKSFISTSAISDFHTALGQCLNYQLMLELNDSQRQLFLAVPLDAYETFFQTRFAQLALKRHPIYLLVYEPVQEAILQWIN